MTKLLKSLLLGAVLVIGLAGVASAKEEAAAAKSGAPALKVGDTVHVCGCGEGCHCATIQAGPGKCGCGKDLIPAKVTKVEGTKITVDRGGKPGETVFTASHKCGCGPGCACNTVALGPGKCHCGKDLVKVD